MKQGSVLLSMFLLSLLCGLQVLAPGQTQPTPLTVFVTILPQKDFVEHIGGGHVNVEVLVPPGKNHETYEPTPRQISIWPRPACISASGFPWMRPWPRNCKTTLPA